MLDVVNNIPKRWKIVIVKHREMDLVSSGKQSVYEMENCGCETQGDDLVTSGKQCVYEMENCDCETQGDGPC